MTEQTRWQTWLDKWLGRGPSATSVTGVDWSAVMAGIPILHGLDDDARLHLQLLAQQFLRQKVITPLGVAPRPEQLASLALQACLPILHLGLGWYRNFYEIILLPDAVERAGPDHGWLDDEWLQETDSVHLGEAWEQGPVVLVWPEVLHDGQWDGYNLVIHELIHKLDMLADGHANGMPPERLGVPIQLWQTELERVLTQVRRQVASGDSGCLDEQAAENAAECLAVSGELFFTRPLSLQQEYPAFYHLLTLWFGEDPALRQPSVTHHDNKWLWPAPVAGDEKGQG